MLPITNNQNKCNNSENKSTNHDRSLTITRFVKLQWTTQSARARAGVHTHTHTQGCNTCNMIPVSKHFSRLYSRNVNYIFTTNTVMSEPYLLEKDTRVSTLLWTRYHFNLYNHLSVLSHFCH